MRLIRLSLSESKKSREIKLPLLLCPIPAGFPSPADDFIEDLLDLQALIVRHPSSTDLSNSEDDSLVEFGVFRGDVLIIDSSLKPAHNDLVVAMVDGELITRQFNKNLRSLTANLSVAPINIEKSNAIIHGVITYSLRSHYNKKIKNANHFSDLKTLLVKKIASTFLARAKGDSLIGVGIFDNDILIIDRSLESFHGKLVVAAINGDFLVKRFDKEKGLLISENPDYPPFDVKGNPSLYIEGIITFSIRSHYWK